MLGVSTKPSQQPQYEEHIISKLTDEETNTPGGQVADKVGKRLGNKQ